MYCGYITTIEKIRKHTNADRLQVCEVFGNNVIVDLSYHVGQKVVYFPTDGQLSEEFAMANNLVRVKDENGNNIGGYMDPGKRNIKAIRLRGEQSDGLVLPIESLSPYADINILKDGDTISVLNGHQICCKYVPALTVKSHNTSYNNHRKCKAPEISYPYFEEHVDTAQLAYNRAAFREGELIVVTRKLHGTSQRISNTIEVKKKRRNFILRKLFHMEGKGYRQFKVVGGTRRTVLSDYNGGYYGNNEFRRKYIEDIADKLPKGMTVYGEIVGWINEKSPIMPICNNKKTGDKEFIKQYGKYTIFTYGCEPGENDFYVYRMTMTNDDGEVIELSTSECVSWCEKLNLKFVPILERFFYTTWEDLQERIKDHLDIPEPLANGRHIVEGIVVRLEDRAKFMAFKEKSFNFKVLEGIIKDTAETPDIEEAEEENKK